MPRSFRRPILSSSTWGSPVVLTWQHSMYRSPAASPPDDTATVVALGVLAATLAAICHEALGHGLGCLGSGGHVALLTSIWFRCSTWSAIIDAAGPAGNLAAGLLAFALLRYCRPGATVRFLLLFSVALNLFWLTGQLAFESLTDRRDDWYWALQMNPPAAWRAAGAVAGIGGYVIVARAIAALVRRQGGPQAHAIRLGYAAAAASAALAGLMWRPEPLRSALEGFLTLGVTPLVLLSIARRASRDGGDEAGARSGAVPRSWIWIAACAGLFCAFILIQARGLGPMAMSRLSP